MLDIGTTMGDGAQLGNASSLHEGQVVPAGAAWHGVPAEPATTNYRVVAPAPRGTLRRFVFGTAEMLGSLVVLSALSGAVITLLTAVPQVPRLLRAAGPGARRSLVLPVAGRRFRCWCSSAVWSSWLAADRSPPARVDPAAAARQDLSALWVPLRGRVADPVLSNSPFFMTMFGDSSAVVAYLAASATTCPRWSRPGRTSAPSCSRTAAPDDDRDRHDGLRRPVDPQRRLLEQLLPRVAHRDRRAQLPGQQHRLPGRRAGPATNCPARHQGPGADRRPGAGECRPARLARLRDPAQRRTRQPVR